MLNDNPEKRASEAKRPPDPVAPEEAALVDVRQEDLMGQESSEGRPPPKRFRIAEWTLVLVFVPLVLIGVIAWAISRGLDARVILVGLVLMLAVIGATSPVWGAGLLRGQEERAARRRARSEIHPTHWPR